MIKQSAHILLTFLLVSAFALFGSSSVVQAQVGLIEDARVTLTDSRPGITSGHQFSMELATGGDLNYISFRYCTQPSGTCTPPEDMVTSSATKGTITGLTGAQWDLVNTGNRVLVLEHATSETISAETVVTVNLNNITNHLIGNCNASSNNSSDTCYIRIRTSDDGGSTTIEETIISVTVIDAVTVTARVDPSFTFVVTGVGDAQTNNGITTTGTSTFNSLPFGNLTPGTPRYLAHQLNVTTNTQAGYVVSARMAQQMVGVYAGNNIDPFIEPWGTPAAWQEPNGTTPNDNTGWFGGNTTNTVVSGWSGTTTGLFGGIGSTAVNVKRRNTSDDGSVPTYVSYAIEVNVFQPADTYQGRLQYNAVPTY